MDKAPDNPIPTVVKLPWFTAPMVLIGFVVGDFINGVAKVTAGYGIGWVLSVVVWIDEVVFIKSRERGCRGLCGYARIWGSDSNLSFILSSKRNIS